MKKLLLILVIGASFAACNNASDSAAKPADSTATPAVDSTAKMSADTTKKDTSAMAPAKDTTTKK